MRWNLLTICKTLVHFLVQEMPCNIIIDLVPRSECTFLENKFTWRILRWKPIVLDYLLRYVFFSLASIQQELIGYGRASFLAINKTDGSISQGKCSTKNILCETRGPANPENLINLEFSGRKTASSRNFRKGVMIVI